MSLNITFLKNLKDEIIKDLIKESILINKKMMRLPFENKI